MADIHQRLFGVALVVAIAGAGAGGYALFKYTREYVPPGGSDVFQVAEGNWYWTTSDSGCAGETHRITFSSDRKVMTITNSRPYEGADGDFDSVANYDVLSHTPGSIRGAIRGETRTTEEGVPVVWDLVMRSIDHYAWRRTDLPAYMQTPRIARCSS